MVVRKLVIWLNVFGFELIFRRSVVNNLRICWVCGEESKVIKVVRLDSLALLLGAGCLLFRGICGRVGVVMVTGNAGKSRCSVMFTVCLCLYRGRDLSSSPLYRVRRGRGNQSRGSPVSEPMA